jgi:uncharacterized membrane protein
MLFDAMFIRLTFEVLGIAVIAAAIGGFISRRRSVLSGAAAGLAAAAILWAIVVLVELRWFARWS